MDNPKCPYCGNEMKLTWYPTYSEREGGYLDFQCDNCFACTPRVKTHLDYTKQRPSEAEETAERKKALAAAMKRDGAREHPEGGSGE